MNQQATAAQVYPRFCSACGQGLPGPVARCPGCGAGVAAAARKRSKVGAALLAFFLGGFGVHKFYLGRWGWGMVYLLFFWTGLPAIAAFIEFILLLVMDEQRFQEKYAGGGGGGAGLVVIITVLLFGGVSCAGILAAIAIPNYLRFQLRAKEVYVKQDLKGLVHAELTAAGRTGRYVVVDGIPSAVPGKEKAALTAAELKLASSLEWTIGPAVHGRYRVAVAERDEVQAASFCAEADVDGDGRLAVHVAFLPPVEEESVELPPAPCTEPVPYPGDLAPGEVRTITGVDVF